MTKYHFYDILVSMSNRRKSTKETGEGLELRRLALASDPELIATKITQRLQKVGHAIATSPDVREVEEDVFSTCSEPIDNRGDRMLRARDTGIPLVEVRLLPADPVYDPLSRLFDIDGSPVYSIFRTDGQQQNRRGKGNFISYQSIGLTSGHPGGIGILAVGGDFWGPEIKSCMDTGDFSGYDDSDKGALRPPMPSFSASTSYEHDLVNSLVFRGHNRDGMSVALDRVEEEFGLASRREGAIEGTAVEIVETPPERQLPGNSLHLPSGS